VTQFLAEPLALLLLSSDEAEGWLGDIAEKRLELYQMGYTGWLICLYDAFWTLDLLYHSVAHRISLLFGK
jgi:hypothetical protein